MAGAPPVSDLTTEMEERLLSDYTFHDITDEQAAAIGDVRAAVWRVARLVAEKAPPGREQSLALTSLEDSVFWTSAAISRHG